MFPAFSTALSALNADSIAVDTVGNNLANLDTTGFKASTVSFQDLVDAAISANHNRPGFGVAPPTITQVYSQGSIQTSSGQFDAAIQGNGFFVVNDSSNGQMYTRNGNFTEDLNGNLLTATGQKVQGWSAVNGVLDTTGTPGNITLPNALLSKPVATQNMAVQVNLDASQAVGSPTSTLSTSIQVFDSLGTAHNVSIQFQKTAANSWSYTVTIPGEDLTAGVAGTPSQLATGTLTFDSAGNLTAPPPPPPASNAAVPVAISGLADGASDLAINWNLYDPKTFAPNVTQLASTTQQSVAENQTQDGSASANITSLTMGNNGEIIAQYSNSNTVVVAQLAIAQIRNPETLAAAGNSLLQATAATSQASIGLPGNGGRGAVLGGALESSTVDIAREFTNLIVYQRSYEANSKVITTANTLSQDTISLVPA